MIRYFNVFYINEIPALNTSIVILITFVLYQDLVTSDKIRTYHDATMGRTGKEPERAIKLLTIARNVS